MSCVTSNISNTEVWEAYTATNSLRSRSFELEPPDPLRVRPLTVVVTINWPAAMKFTFWIFVMTVSLAQIKAAVNIERTIEKVQNILKQNSKLPQLTRDEILQLLEDIRANDATSTSTTLPLVYVTTSRPKENDVENEINTGIFLTPKKILKTAEKDGKTDLEIDEEISDEALVTSRINSNQQIETTTQKGWYSLDEGVSYDDTQAANTIRNQIFETTTIKEWYNFNKGISKDESLKSTRKKNQKFETTTKKVKPALMVVLPYTQSDGSSLQELYTRPPRIKVVEDIELNSDKAKQTLTSPKQILPNKPAHGAVISEKLNKNAKIAMSLQTPPELADLSAELKEFLDAHGLKGNPGPEDHFLLPLEGFKPLPPARTVDGSVELPENILLTYDLVSPSSSASGILNKNNVVPAMSPNNFLFDPLKPKYPFELDTSASNPMTSVLPLELPHTKKINKQPDYSPIDYDSVKIIPLPKGPNPVNDAFESLELENELRKRQTANSSDSSSTSEDVATTSDASMKDITGTTDTSTGANINLSTTNTSMLDVSNDSVSANTDTGASIKELEDSFGAPAPSQPGDSTLPPPRKNGFYWMLDWNSFLEVGLDDRKVNIRFEPKLGDPQMFLPINVP
ncbi:hypothetical protein EVAR_55345_1 [Eumeta japonica]|uniref:Uncharacterized protein n=1 Tax=Eumeta variegata TaxID=151549 RepID=A0A4C1YKB0_EUMVA|nr:hypothetical protein EVAR_55345_1 [Eumeta japonica]